MSIKSVFAAELRRAREEQHFTQDNVSEIMSMSTRWYQAMESQNETKLAKNAFSHIYKIVRLACFFNIDLNMLKDELMRLESITVPRHIQLQAQEKLEKKHKAKKQPR